MKNLVMVYSAFIFLIACEKSDPIIPNEEEVITTLIYTLSPISGGAPSVFKFVDLDGNGGNAPVVEVDPLAVNQIYQGQLQLKNEQNFPIDDISQEILEEDEEHQFFFQTTLDGLEIKYADSDGNGNPVGLATTVTCGTVGTGRLTITLRHEPDKMALGVAEGNLNNAGGETDIEITFDINVQ